MGRVTAEFLEGICRQVAERDLNGVPLYVLLASELPAEAGGVCSFFGYTTASLDVFLRGHIGERWQGRGPCMVIGDDALRQRLPAQMVADQMLGTALHELAHALADFWPYYGEQLDENFVEYAGKVVADHSAQDCDKQLLDDVSGVLSHTFLSHGPRWIRTCLHLRHRAQKAGHFLRPKQIIGEQTVIRPWSYAACIDDEPAALESLPIREIFDRPLPQRFADLWEEDRQDFISIEPSLPDREQRHREAHEFYIAAMKGTL